MASNGKIEIEKFNGQSFELWKLKMEDLLVDKDQWIAVDPGTKPKRVSDEEWKKLDQKPKSTIRLCVSYSVLLNVSGEATTKALWENLGTLYQYKSLVNKLFLRKKLYSLRTRDGDSVTEHLNAFNIMVSQLASVDIKISDEDNPSFFCVLYQIHGIVWCKTVFEKDTCKIVRGALVLMRGVRIGTLYMLQGSTIIDGCNSSVVPESGAENLVVSGEKTMLWHQSLGHIGEKGLWILHGKGMEEGMSNSSLYFDLCENCVYGNQNRVSFLFGSKRAKKLLELVHSDVFRPMKVPSLGKFVYYVSFIDDFSRNTWIYFIKKKSKVFDRFKEFKALVEN
eukprot:PITA_04981